MKSDHVTRLVPNRLKQLLPQKIRLLTRQQLYKLDAEVNVQTLIVVADSLRYDVAIDYETDWLSHKNLMRGYTDACWTIPSHEAIIRGNIPCNDGVGSDNITENDYYKSATPMSLQHPHSFGFTAMPYLGTSKYVANPFSNYFDEYRCFSDDGNYCGKKIRDAAIEQIEKHQNEPWFGLLNFGETHQPWSVSPEEAADLVEDAQSDEEAQELITGMMGSGFETIQRRVREIEEVCPSGTQIILTSDHGELIGENGAVGHGMDGGFHEKLFEVPTYWWTVG